MIQPTNILPEELAPYHKKLEGWAPYEYDRMAAAIEKMLRETYPRLAWRVERSPNEMWEGFAAHDRELDDWVHNRRSMHSYRADVDDVVVNEGRPYATQKFYIRASYGSLNGMTIITSEIIERVGDDIVDYLAGNIAQVLVGWLLEKDEQHESNHNRELRLSR